MKEILIKFENVQKIYKTGVEDTYALKGINLEIEKGDFVAIMGPSGSGKSTLMHILGLLDTPSAGAYYLNGRDVSKLRKNELARIRNQEIGFVFQQFNLLPRTTVLDNVLMPAMYGNLKNEREQAKNLLKLVGLEDRMFHKSNQLSGGQVQRVAIARSLIMSPSLILADEPTGNLDTRRSEEIMDLFKEINKQGGTIVLITHEEDVAKHANRIIKIKDGELHESIINTLKHKVL